ncbi:hypothetical protein GCM10027199_64750 [Amycolatopsis magusensis]
MDTEEESLGRRTTADRGRLSSPDTPSQMRVLGGVMLVASLAGVFAVWRRMARQG